MKRLNEKVAIVTGANSGMGKAIAEFYAREGAKVVLCARRDDQGQEVVKQIKASGGEAIWVHCDVTNEKDIKNVVDTTIGTYGKLDIFCSNSGIALNYPTFDEVTLESWEKTFATNTRPCFLFLKYCINYLVESKGCVVVNTSMAALRGVSVHYSYAASKAALARFAQVIAIDYAPKGVRVNCMCPGLINTPMIGSTPPDVVKALEDEIPLKRIGQPEDIANLAVFLASDEASFITGQLISCDGGATL